MPRHSVIEKQNVMKLLIFDNYDSFTYNIVHAVRSMGIDPDVKRNDSLKLEEIDCYDKIIISPGPGIPSEAGLLMPMLQQYADKKSILGICLGHQALSEHFGARLVNLDNVYHGVAKPMDIVLDDYIFDGIARKVIVGRYHSWAVDAGSYAETPLEITAVAEDGTVMAMRHKTLDVRGLQFHPESIMTPDGYKMIENWIKH